MKLFRQPWFLILVMIASLYTYKYYKNAPGWEISTNKALAVQPPQLSKDEIHSKDSEASAQETQPVQLQKDFPSKKVASFEVATYQGLDIEMVESDVTDIELHLLGEGTQFRNQGENLSDWFLVTLRKGTLRVASYEKKGSFDFASLKSLAKVFSGSEASSLKLRLLFPKNHKFKKLKFETVTSSVEGKGLQFVELKLATVSGSASLKQSQGKRVKIETVSGNAKLDLLQLESGKMSTVSGSFSLSLSESSPSVDFESVSGNLALKMPAESDVDVEFESMTGDLINEFGVSKKTASHIQFSSLSGSASIRKIQ